MIPASSAASSLNAGIPVPGMPFVITRVSSIGRGVPEPAAAQVHAGDRVPVAPWHTAHCPA